MCKCKIWFTLVIWTLGMSLEIAKYTIELWNSDSIEDTSFYHSFKLYNLKHDEIDYSLVLFGCIFITEYLPLSTLQFSLLKSYRNNRIRKCGDPLNEEEEYLNKDNNYCDFDEAEARYSYNSQRKRG
jgi:hypothetical protein